MGFKCNICGKTDGFHGDCGKTAKVSESTETDGCAQDALKILKRFSRIRNDTEAYIHTVIQWGLGEVDEEPNPKDYGLM